MRDPQAEDLNAPTPGVTPAGVLAGKRNPVTDLINAVSGPQQPIGVPAGTTVAGLQSQSHPVQSYLTQVNDPAAIQARQDKFTQRRVGLLLAEGHGWMPPTGLFTLAAAGMPNDKMLAAADAVRKAALNPAGFLTAAASGFTYFAGDPVLSKEPSASLALKRYLNQTVGPWPIQDADLGHIQSQMQRAGFGGTLQANAMWTPEWNAAYRQFSQHLVNSQLAGQNLASLPPGSAVNILTSWLPKKAGNAILGFVKSLPGSARSIMSDLAAAGGSVADVATNPLAQGDAHRYANVAGGFVEGQSPQEYAHGRTLQMLDDIGTLLLLHDGLKAGSSVALAAGESILPSTAVRAVGAEAGSLAATTAATTTARQLSLDAAQRGPGVIARSLGRGVDLGDLKALQNIPVLRDVGPWVAKLNDADGLYYRARTMLAAPYRYAPVRAAGDALSTLGRVGAETRGVGVLEQKLGDPRLEQAVAGEHTLDAVDDSLHKLRFTVGGVTIKPSLDDLAFLLHPSPGHASAEVGQRVDELVDGAHAALGDTGLAAQIERGTGAHVGNLVKDAGGDENYLRFWSQKIREHAAAHYAEDMWNRLDPSDRYDPLTPGWVKQLRDFQHEAWTDPQVMGRAVAELQGSPDELANRIARDITSSKIAPKAWLSQEMTRVLDASKVVRDELVPLEGSLVGDGRQVGLARLDTLTREEALEQIDALQARHDALATGGGSYDDALKLRSDAADLLFREFGVDARRQPQIDVASKLAMARQHTAMLASTVTGAPEETVAKLAELGYKPVAGTDIGWMHRDLTPLDALEGPLTRRRRLAETLGLNPDRYSTASIGQQRNLGIRRQIQAQVDAGRVTLPPLYTTDTVMADLRDAGIIDSVRTQKGVLDRSKTAIADLFGVPDQRATDEYANELAATPAGSTMTPAQLRVYAQAKARDEITGALQLRDIPRQKVIDVLTRKQVDTIPVDTLHELAAQLGRDPDELRALGDVPLMPKQDAERVYRAIVKGSTAPGSYMLGLSHIEDLARASMGFAGDSRVAAGLSGAVGGALIGGGIGAARGDNPLHTAAVGAVAGGLLGARDPGGLANLPNRLVQIRNDIRFQMSPYFDFRRVAKTNAKLAAEGVAPTVRPLAAMDAAGTYEEDRSLLRRLLGPAYTTGMEGADDAERYLHSQSIFGLYNGRHYEAYAAGQWARQGLSDPEIQQKLTKVFGYGTAAGEGRSALERSTNFLFFPFSFDKTMYRNFGGYLLDRPGQMILLNNALRSYKVFNDAHLNGNNPLAASWIEQHLPVLEEANRLNAFAHGLSLGQPGGINAPILNMFMPQKWTASNGGALKTLGQFVPAVKDLQRLFKEVPEQAVIAGRGLSNLMRTPSYTLDYAPSTQTADAQQQAAFGMRMDWYKSYADAIDFNKKNRSQRAAFPDDRSVYGPLAGKDITKGNIDLIVAHHYPAYDPAFGADFATKQKQAIQEWVDSRYGDKNYDQIKGFADLAKQAAGLLARVDDSGNYTTADAVKDTQQLRDLATGLASKDPDFYKAYNQFFRAKFGPLEKVGG